MSDLGRKFDGAMFDLYRQIKVETKYNAIAFLQMITDRGGVATAKALINSPKISDGYAALVERGRLDLTVEAFVVGEPGWHTLFAAEELGKARERLKLYNFQPKTR